MLQVGSTVRIKPDAFKDSHDPLEFDLRGRIGTVKFELANAWEVQVDDEFFILDDTEFDEVEFTEKITPDTPQNRRFAALIRSGIETLGWDEFEQLFVDATGLVLATNLSPNIERRPSMTEIDPALSESGFEHYNQPQTTAEWQEALNLANFLLMVDAARQYGLITGGPKVNIERCQEIMAQAGLRGLRPEPGSVQNLLKIHLSNDES